VGAQATDKELTTTDESDQPQSQGLPLGAYEHDQEIEPRQGPYRPDHKTSYQETVRAVCVPGPAHRVPEAPEVQNAEGTSISKRQCECHPVCHEGFSTSKLC